MAVSKSYWAVTCLKKRHGMEEKGVPGVRWVKVGPPKGKERQHNTGCPYCAAEELADRRLVEPK